MAVNQVVVKLGADISDLQAKLRDAAGAIDKAVKGPLARAGADLEKIGATMTGIGSKMTMGLTLPLVGVGAAALKTAADFEQAQVAFTTMLGSATKATQLLDNLKEFAASTPFEFPEIQTAAKSLLAFGVGADEMTDTLRRLGDISAGVGAPLNDIAQIYGKARVQGRLFSEDINQLTGRGIPVIQELAKQFGVTDESVKQLVTDGKVNFSHLERAFDSLTAKGSQFGGMMEAQSQTLAGKWSTFKDEITMTFAEIGASLIPVAKSVLESFTPLLGAVKGMAERFATLPKPVQNLVIGFAGVLAAAGPLIYAIGAMTSGIGKAIKMYVAANAWIRALTASKVADTVATGANTAAQATNTGAVTAGTAAWRGHAAAIGIAAFRMGAIVAAFKMISSAAAIANGQFDGFMTRAGRASGMWQNIKDSFAVMFGMAPTGGAVAGFELNFKDVDAKNERAVAAEIARLEKWRMAVLRRTVNVDPNSEKGRANAAGVSAIDARIMQLQSILPGGGSADLSGIADDLAGNGTKNKLTAMQELAEATDHATRRAQVLGDGEAELAERISAHRRALDRLIEEGGGQSEIDKVATALSALERQQTLLQRGPSVWAELSKGVADATRRSALLGSEIDGIAEKIAAYRRAFDRLIEEGAPDKQVREVAASLKALEARQEAIRKMTGEQKGLAGDFVNAWRNAFKEAETIATETAGSFLMKNEELSRGVSMAFARIQSAFEGASLPSLAAAGAPAIIRGSAPATLPQTVPTVIINGDAAAMMSWTAKTADGAAARVIQGMARELLAGA